MNLTPHIAAYQQFTIPFYQRSNHLETRILIHIGRYTYPYIWVQS